MRDKPPQRCDERAHLLAAAGLLHDAGKLGQPAGIELPDRIRRMEQLICPTDPATGRPTHLHALYTASIIDQARSNFGGLGADVLLRLAASHHRPGGEDFDAHLVTKADRLASGHDRRDLEDSGDIWGLQPVLASVSLPGGSSPIVAASPQHLPTAPLQFDEDSFLPVDPQDRPTYVQRCRELTDALLRGLAVSYVDPAQCVERMLALTARIFHAVPSSRSPRQQADVSLFDHSRVVAAFAAALAVQHVHGACDANRIVGRYRLISIALGGIQKFIFRHVPPLDAEAGESGEKGMAKLLRARSFYVSLLSYLAARRILDATGLPPVNLMLDAGGRCAILIPDTAQIMSDTCTAAAYVREWFDLHLRGSIRLELAISEPLADENFSEIGFSATYRNTDQLLARARLQPQIEDLRSSHGWAEHGWVDDSESMPIDRSPFLQSMRRLGRALPRADFLSLDSSEPGALDPPAEILGYRVQLHQHLPHHGRVFALRLDAADDLTIPLFITASHLPLASTEDVQRLQAPSELAAPRESDDEEPLAVGEPLTFSDLAALSTDQSGKPLPHAMLAALKADVDRLGLLMGYGLGAQVSFGRLASMSRSLDLFFKGFLSQQLRRNYRHVYSVFGGGDDLFLIGPWYDMVRLLTALRQWFARLTCGNPHLTFSAGLVFTSPSTPVRHIAHLADQALEKAKDEGRNRICVGSQSMSWDDLQRAMDLHHSLLESLQRNEKGVNPSFVYRLLQYACMALGIGRDPDRPVSPADLKWRAQLSYDLRRNLPEAIELQQQLMSIRSATDAVVLHTAAMLTLYFIRGGSS